jgi:hypothetical protein
MWCCFCREIHRTLHHELSTLHHEFSSLPCHDLESGDDRGSGSDLITTYRRIQQCLSLDMQHKGPGVHRSSMRLLKGGASSPESASVDAFSPRQRYRVRIPRPLPVTLTGGGRLSQHQRPLRAV